MFLEVVDDMVSFMHGRRLRSWLVPWKRIVAGRSFKSAFVALLLSSCGGVSSNSHQAHGLSLPRLVSPGSIRQQENVTSTVSGAAVFKQGSNPNISSPISTFISKNGFLVEATADVKQSEIFGHAKPLSKWVYLSSVPGVVTQLDFDSVNSGFTLVQKAGDISVTSLYSTSDGGKHWKEVSSGEFVKVHFFDSQSGIAVSNPPGGPRPSHGPEILITTDGGHSWNVELPPALAQVSLSNNVYTSFSFVSKDGGWLALGGQPGAGSEEKWLFGTADGGHSWTRIASTPSLSSTVATLPASPGLPTGGYLKQIRFVSPTLGYLVLARGAPGGVLKTVDGGIHWIWEQLLRSDDFRPTSIAELAPVTPVGGIAVTDTGSIWNQVSFGTPWKEV